MCDPRSRNPAAVFKCCVKSELLSGKIRDQNFDRQEEWLLYKKERQMTMKAFLTQLFSGGLGATAAAAATNSNSRALSIWFLMLIANFSQASQFKQASQIHYLSRLLRSFAYYVLRIIA